MVLLVKCGRGSPAEALTNYVTCYRLQFLRSLHERSTLSNAEIPEPAGCVFVEEVLPSVRSVSAWNITYGTAIVPTPV